MSFVCEIIQLFFVGFYNVRAVQKSEFRLVINEKIKLRHTVTEIRVFERICIFHTDLLREC